MKFIFQSTSAVQIATNTFISFPVILQYEDTPLIQVVRFEEIGFTTEIPVYHPDGTYLAKVRGNRIYKTAEGKKANLEMKGEPGKVICILNGKVILELTTGVGDKFRADAELYAPDGYFVKCSESHDPQLFRIDSSEIPLFQINDHGIKVGGLSMSGNTFVGGQIGIWLRKDGSCSFGVK